jgi:hypothetical protein
MVQITEKEAQLFRDSLAARILQFMDIAEKELQERGETVHYKRTQESIERWAYLIDDLYKRSATAYNNNS